MSQLLHVRSLAHRLDCVFFWNKQVGLLWRHLFLVFYAAALLKSVDQCFAAKSTVHEEWYSCSICKLWRKVSWRFPEESNCVRTNHFNYLTRCPWHHRWLRRGSYSSKLTSLFFDECCKERRKSLFQKPKWSVLFFWHRPKWSVLTCYYMNSIRFSSVCDDLTGQDPGRTVVVEPWGRARARRATCAETHNPYLGLKAHMLL